MRSPSSLMPSVITPPAVIPGTVFVSRTNTDWVLPSSLLSPPLANDQRYNIPQVVVIVVIVFTSVFLSVTCYVAFIKHCLNWTRILNWTNRDQTASDHRVANDVVEQVDHPIWLMTSVGLQPSVINSIKLTTFKSEEDRIEGTDCSVCLGEFQEDDALRLLPKCNHPFHVICIDTWLASHTNCPLCRVDVVVTSPRPCLRQLRLADLPQLEDSDSNDVDVENNQTGSSSTGDPYEIDSTTNYNNNNNDQSKSEDGNIIINSNGERICFSLEVHGSNPQITGDMLSQSNASSSSFRITSSLLWSPLVTKKRSYSWNEEVH